MPGERHRSISNVSRAESNSPLRPRFSCHVGRSRASASSNSEKKRCRTTIGRYSTSIPVSRRSLSAVSEKRALPASFRSRRGPGPEASIWGPRIPAAAVEDSLPGSRRSITVTSRPRPESSKGGVQPTPPPIRNSLRWFTRLPPQARIFPAISRNSLAARRGSRALMTAEITATAAAPLPARAPAVPR